MYEPNQETSILSNQIARTKHISTMSTTNNSTPSTEPTTNNTSPPAEAPTTRKRDPQQALRDDQRGLVNATKLKRDYGEDWMERLTGPDGTLSIKGMYIVPMTDEEIAEEDASRAAKGLENVKYWSLRDIRENMSKR
jgi:hypothetical protein